MICFPPNHGLWICGQSASPIPTFALRAILGTARGKRDAFPTARPQTGNCPQTPQTFIIGYEISNSKPSVQTHTSIGIDWPLAQK
jgi:hypothetical protein